MEVLLCPKCSLAQLSVVVDPKVLYENYKYVTSPSATMQTHFWTLWNDIKEQQPCRHKVLEIGSNDGRFLKFLIDNQQATEVMGVDPAANLVADATAHGVRTHTALFTHEFAKDCLFQPDVIVARHVFCHVENWKDFIAGIEEMALPSTLVCIEVPYCRDMLAKTEFDTIYHEHTSYLTIRSVLALLEGTNLMLWKVKRYAIHGGAIMLMIRRRDGKFVVDPSVHEFVRDEGDMETEWANFSRRAKECQQAFNRFVRGLAITSVVGAIGASAKSTVWVNACDMNRDQIKYIADTTEYKQGCLVPGSDIPVVSESRLNEFPPDVAVVFAWNYRDEVIKKFEPLRAKGTKLLFPVPSVEIV